MPQITVVLTNHAKKRCYEQGISPEYVRRTVEAMPNFTGEYQWNEKNKFIVIVKFVKDIRLVVTVIGSKKLIRSRKYSRFYKGAGMRRRYRSRGRSH